MGDTETVLMLAALTSCKRHVIERMLWHRPKGTWRARQKRVTELLEREHMLRDQLEKPTLSHRSECRLHLRIGVKKRNVKAMHAKVKARRQMRHLRAKLAQSQKRINRLESTLFHMISAKEDEQEEGECGDESLDPQVCDILLQESKELILVDPKQRRYSATIQQIGQLLNLTSPKTYRILRQLIPLPSPSLLWNRFSTEMSTLSRMLLEQSAIPTRIRTITRGFDDRNPLIATIGVDAFSFQTFSGMGTLTPAGERQEYSHGFLFVSIPLDPNYQVKVIHIEPKSNGAFDRQIDSTIEFVVRSYNEANGKVCFIATDGDRYMNGFHDSFYNQFVEPNEADFFFVVNSLETLVQRGTPVPISDPLHLGKNLRGKLIDHNIACLFRGCEVELVNNIVLDNALHLGDTLNDPSQIGRMRDYYVTHLFTLENVLKLLRGERYDAAILLLPFACMFTVIYARNLTTESRIFFIRLSYYSFLKLFKESERLVKAKAGVSHRHSARALAVTMAEPCYFRRMLNTCLGFGLALARGPKTLRLDSIGSHLVENQIGTARSVSNSTNFAKIVTAFANCDMRKNLAQDLGVTIHVSRRINDGGAKIDTIEDRGVTHPQEWDPNDIVSLLCEKALDFGASDTCEYDTFIEELSALVVKIDLKHLHRPGKVANALIVERNRSFRARNEQ